MDIKQKTRGAAQEESNRTVTPAEHAVRAAHIYLPAGFRGLPKSISGELASLQITMPDLFAAGDTVPVIVLMQGSSDRVIYTRFEEHVCDELGIALVALNTRAVPNRPTYTTPATDEEYQLVHELRKQEIDAFLDHIDEFGWVDKHSLILAGVSEGGVAVACHPGSMFRLRIIVSWSCEPRYFLRDVELGGDSDCYYLNIIGSRDEYFSPHSKLSQGKLGHCTESLEQKPNSKVVIGHHHQ